MINLLDVTGLSKEEQNEKIGAEVNGLQEGEQLEIMSNGDYNEIVGGLVNKLWGNVEWYPFLNEAGTWSGRFTKNTASPTGILGAMEAHHKYCDTLYVKGENEISSGAEETGKMYLRAFLYNMELHFHREETILFPAFEERTGMTQGPTQVMRAEHEQIRGVLNEMKKSYEAADYQKIFDRAETLLILVQQHNSKEENMLYPMCDQHLLDIAEELTKKLILLQL
jgi:hemerythrin superfamily protein